MGNVVRALVFVAALCSLSACNDDDAPTVLPPDPFPSCNEPDADNGFDERDVSGLTFDGDRFLAVTVDHCDAALEVWTSEQAAEWTALTAPPAPAAVCLGWVTAVADRVAIQGLAAAGDCAAGADMADVVWTSTDAGLTWHETRPADLVAHLDDIEVAAAADGFAATIERRAPDGQFRSELFVSGDGRTWTATSVAPDVQSVNAVA